VIPNDTNAAGRDPGGIFIATIVLRLTDSFEVIARFIKYFQFMDER
jgi:hypothetical protein